MATASRITEKANAKAIPPLRNGDHLTVNEFLRRYEAMPHVKKAELIEGVVYMPSPVSMDHGTPHAALMTWLGTYWAMTSGVELGDNATVLLDLGENCPQPDACLRIKPGQGGQSGTSEAGYVQGAPELTAEVAASTVSYDLHDKLCAYQRNGVQEYIVWRVEDEAIDWFVLRGEKYRALAPRDGIYHSKVFPGLWLDVQAMLQGDLAKVLKVLQQGLASNEHQRFVKKLQRRKR
jgi:Uma2 family endonuclease